MKKLLYLSLLFISCNRTYSQLTFTHRNTGFSTSGIGSIGSQTYEAGKLYICFTGTTNPTSPAVVSLSGGASTWTEIANIVSDGDNMRLQAFRYAPAANETTDVTVTYTGSQDGGFLMLCTIDGANVTGTNGSNGIAQVVTDAIDANANPTITLSSLQSNSGVMAAFINNANPFGGTAESGYTEQIDQGYNTPTTGGYYMTRNNNGDNTPTVTASSSDWAGLAIEIKAATIRRIMTVN